jgi:hypothetical protein
MTALKRLLIASVLSLAAAAQVANAGSMTDYLENKIVDWLFRGQTFTRPPRCTSASSPPRARTPPPAPR